MVNKIRANYHTHIFLCKHAIGDVEDYVKKAINLRYHTIAITDHGPLPKFLQKKLNSRRMSIEQYKEIYLDSLARAKEIHKEEILVLSGLEIEYMDELLLQYPIFLSELDFLILGQHYIKVNNEYKSIYSSLNDDEIKLYGDTVVRAMRSGYFKILAHPEIFAWNIKDWNQTCIDVSNQIIDAAILYNVILEINVNGVRNSFYQRKEFYQDDVINFPYPRREFWKLVKTKNAKVMINDDAHAPNRMHDEYTEYIYELATKMQLNVVDRIEGINQ